MQRLDEQSNIDNRFMQNFIKLKNDEQEKLDFF